MKHTRARIFVAKMRAANRWHDLRAVLAGYCNDHPNKDGLPGRPGWLHWRCALPRGHDGEHRARNYRWNAETSTYDPIPHGQPMPHQPWDRHLIHTRRQARRLNHWHEERRREILGEAALP